MFDQYNLGSFTDIKKVRMVKYELSSRIYNCMEEVL
jgi:hypothetical protein